MPSNIFIPGLIAGMIVTGACDILLIKWQDMQCVERCDDPQHQVLYEQPVWQTFRMFFGEMLCFLPILFTWLRMGRQTSPTHLSLKPDPQPNSASQQLRGRKVLILWLPAACDLMSATLMNIGLLYTPVSIFQMIRGASVLFVGVLSVIFLRRWLWLYQWTSLIVVMAGIALVGLSGTLISHLPKERGVLERRVRENSVPGFIDEPESTTVLIGVSFVLMAQIFSATQLVIEENIMSRYAVAPLFAIAFEGLFGFVTMLILSPILSIPSVASRSPFFDLPRGWHQTVGNPSVFWSGAVIACSSALFVFFGLNVTRHVSATARSLVETCRTLAIWLVSLGLGWETFVFPISLLQVLGFSLLVYGTLLFNDLVKPPPCLPKPQTAYSVVPDDAEAAEYPEIPDAD